jgi:hypothetical protein
LSAALPSATNHEQVKAITMRGGKTTQDPPYPKGIVRTPAAPATPEEKKNDEVEEIIPQEHEMRQDFHDINFLPFPRRVQKI